MAWARRRGPGATAPLPGNRLERSGSARPAAPPPDRTDCAPMLPRLTPLTPLRALVLVQLVLLLVVAAATVARLPVWSLVDEGAHFDYVQKVAEDGRLPVLKVDFVSDEVQAIQDDIYPAPARTRQRDAGLAGRSYEGVQPPLYYVAAAPPSLLVADHRDRAYLLRALNLVLLFGTIFLVSAPLRRGLRPPARARGVRSGDDRAAVARGGGAGGRRVQRGPRAVHRDRGDPRVVARPRAAQRAIAPGRRRGRRPGAADLDQARLRRPGAARRRAEAGPAARGRAALALDDGGRRGAPGPRPRAVDDLQPRPLRRADHDGGRARPAVPAARPGRPALRARRPAGEERGPAARARARGVVEGVPRRPGALGQRRDHRSCSSDCR